MQYPEINSLKESLEILDRYKKQLTKEQYEAMKSNIYSFNIEDMHINELDIIGAIQVLKNEKTSKDLIKYYKAI